MPAELKIALIQLAVVASKQLNLTKVKQLVEQAASKGAKLICLPECFNSPYGVKHFSKYAETLPGESGTVLAALAKEHKIYLVGGSIPEEDNGRLYNTCLAYGPDGTLLAKHRKVHLFDIDIPGKITFKESDALTAGNELTMFNTPFCKIGLGICYDMRFAPMAQIYAQKGCKLLLYPGAFNMTTGPAHWELLQRARAVDNQVFVAAISPARDASSGYEAWGHTTVVSPWGDILATSDHTEQIVYSTLDFSKVDEIRNQIPISAQAREDIYRVVYNPRKESAI